MTEHTKPATAPVSDVRRRELLEQAVARSVANGWRVEVMNQTNAVLVTGSRTNHVLHLLLTLFTFGLWAIVWIGMAMSGGEKRTTITVDPYGNVSWDKPHSSR